jgi:hypothetical protein
VYRRLVILEPGAAVAGVENLLKATAPILTFNHRSCQDLLTDPYPPAPKGVIADFGDDAGLRQISG